MSEEINKKSLELHHKHKGKICIHSKVPIETAHDLALAYTPGVAEPSLQIAKDKNKVYDYTAKGNLVAVVSNGTAVLGLGDIGPEASIPVMEGKAVLFRRFGGIDAFPICIDEKDPYKLAEIIKKISPVFGGINLEDIKAPECFIVEKIVKELDMPVMHDDQHGTAIVVLAALINAVKVVGKDKNVKITISGAGAAGIAIAKLLLDYGFKNVILCDTKGAIYSGRTEGMNFAKDEIAKLTNKEKEKGALKDIISGKDVFIGVSSPNLLTKEDIKKMNSPIVFAMSNPTPEIMPDEAKAGGAKVIATGRSDFPNQVNNVLAFPGVFKGALEIRAKITEKMKLAAAEALASMVKNPTSEKIIPSVFDEGVADKVAEAVKKQN